ncbi:MAG: phosphoesterase [Christensenellales bacterium]|jgi:hypothetical protein
MDSAYDLHIHSCLSPCASDDMTPANIAGMARLKGLSVISLTDHNTGRNLKSMHEAAQQNDLIFVPGIEVTSKEEVHILVYFPKLSAAIKFTEQIYDSLPAIDNHPELFGNQIVMDIYDHPAGTLRKLLLQATPYTMEDIDTMAKDAGGCAIPAHINRDSFSVLSNLGFIPSNLFSCVEIAKNLPCPAVDKYFKKLYSSDAHCLGDISEPQFTLPDISTPQDIVYFASK